MKKFILAFLFLVLIIPTVSAAKPDIPKEKKMADTCTTIQSGELLNSAGNPITTGFDEWGYNYQGKLFNGLYCDSYRDAAWCQPYSNINLMMKWNDAWLSNKDCNNDGDLDRHYGHDSYIDSGAWLTNHQSGEYDTYYLNKKDSNTWEVIEPDINGVLTTHDNKQSFEFYGYGLEVEREYTLINYGGWDNINCLGTIESDIYGGLSLSGTIPQPVLWDEANNEGFEKFWLIPSEYVSCQAGTIQWVPSKILFDNNIDADCSWNYFVKIVAAPADAVSTDGVWYSGDGIEIGPTIWGAFAITQEVDNDTCTGSHGLLYKSPLNSGLGYFKP